SKSADTRAALVDYFRNSADIMIATEAAAEGINLQFCSLVVNYDLPWNPQRIEQRIGRCHRYGQKYDVVVVNFLNTKNLADKRVFELLSEKFKLFDGVFGSSDEVLGSIESGVDFEKRINEIYSRCRTQDEINLAFDELKESLNEQILSRLEQTRKQLLENFDEEVQEKLRINLVKNKEYIDKFSANLWNLARYVLGGKASFDEENFTFDIAKPNANSGHYTINNQEQGEKLRAEHPLAKHIFDVAKRYSVKNQSVTFDLSNHETIVSVLAPLQGKSGQLSIYNLEIGSIEEESYLIYAGVTDDGKKLSSEAIQKLFTLNASVDAEVFAKRSALSNLAEKEKDKILATLEKRNSKFFDEEMDKLERWCADLKKSLEVKLRQMDIDIKTMKTECRKLPTLAEKLVMQKQIKDVESKRNKLRLNLYEEQDNLDSEKDKLIDSVAEKLKQNVKFEELFTIKWRVV
ncbi:MAG: helicase-related protein, partial [Clostridia bacterium]